MRFGPPLRIVWSLAATGLISCGGPAVTPSPPDRPSALEVVGDAAGRTLAAGPAHVRASVRSSAVEYDIDGRVGPLDDGYRFCGRVGHGTVRYTRDRLVLLEGDRADYYVVTTAGRRCTPEALWLDDHPPTLPLFVSDDLSVPLGGQTGAEYFLHAALLALNGLSGEAVAEARERTCGPSHCYSMAFDFARLDRDPRRRDEDGWQMRPLLQSFGTRPVEVLVDADGFIERVSLQAPSPVDASDTVRVRLDLSRFGQEEPVPHVVAHAME